MLSDKSIFNNNNSDNIYNQNTFKSILNKNNFSFNNKISFFYKIRKKNYF